MNIVKDLTCSYCNKIYEDPIILDCCGQNICKKDIQIIKTNQENCPNVECQKNTFTFKSNNIVKMLIENYELNKIPFESEYEKVLKELNEKIDKLEKIKSNPENIIYEKFSELKRKIDLDREYAKHAAYR